MPDLAGTFLGEEVYWIPGFNLRYAITKSGRIASTMIGSNHFTGWLSARMLKTGYMQSGLCDPVRGKQCGYYVHRLVAATFLDLVLTDVNTQVDHIDKNKANNHVDNLRLCNASQNTLWSYNTGDLDTETHKECRKCHIVKSRSEFYVNNANVDKLHSYCKSCQDLT